MISSYSFHTKSADPINVTDTTRMKFTMSTTVSNDENLWNNIKVIKILFSELQKLI